MRTLAQSAIVDNDNGAALRAGFLLKWLAGLLLPRSNLFLVALPCFPRWPLRAPSQAHQHLPHIEHAFEANACIWILQAAAHEVARGPSIGPEFWKWLRRMSRRLEFGAADTSVELLKSCAPVMCADSTARARSGWRRKAGRWSKHLLPDVRDVLRAKCYGLGRSGWIAETENVTEPVNIGGTYPWIIFLQRPSLFGNVRLHPKQTRRVIGACATRALGLHPLRRAYVIFPGSQRRDGGSSTQRLQPWHRRQSGSTRQTPWRNGWTCETPSIVRQRQVRSRPP